MTDVMALSPQERQFVVRLDAYIDEHGHSPSLREMSKMLGYLNVSSAQAIADRLLARRVITRVRHAPRTLRLAGGVVVHNGDVYMTVEIDA